MKRGRLSALAALLVGLLLLATIQLPSTHALWFRSQQASTATLRSGSVDLITPGSGSGGRAADWSATLISLPASGPVAYAEVPSPLPLLRNTGTVKAFYAVSRTTSTAAGPGTTTAGAAAFAGHLRASVAKIVAGQACNAANFAAGTIVAGRDPVGTDSGLLTITPSASRSLNPGAEHKLCVRYDLSAAGSATGSWGRTVAVTWSFIAVNEVSGTFTSAPVTWKHVVRMYVPAPVAPPAGSGKVPCTASGGLLGGSMTLSWGWPVASDYVTPGLDAASGFDLYFDNVRQTGNGFDVLATSGGARGFTVNIGVLSGVLGATTLVEIVARAGDGSSVRYKLGTLTKPPLGLGVWSCG